MNVFIFLTLLCLGMASAAPNHSAEAQSDLWMVNMAGDTINSAALEKSPEALQKDYQEQSKENQGIQTTRNASDYVTLQMKIFRGRFGMMKGVARKSLLKKAVKGIGKTVVGGILNPENVGEIAYVIGKKVLEGKKAEDSLPAPEVVTETVQEF